MRRRVMCVLCALLLLGPGAAYARERETLDIETLKRLALFSAVTDELMAGEMQVTIDPSKPMIALTFDDGPSDYTPRIVELLAQYGCRSTFFMVGNRVKNYRAAVEQVVAQGNEVATHTWSHPDLTDLSRGEIASQLTQSISMIESASGQSVTLMRPPYGAIDDEVRAVCRELGLPLIYWSIDTEDWRTKNAQKTAEAILSEVRPGCIILCHDIVPSTAEAMETVIPALVEQGYQLVTVSELMQFLNVEAKPGRVYYSIGE